MHFLTRRTFVTQLLVGSLFPPSQLWSQDAQPLHGERIFSEQETELVRKFLDGHEKRLAPLRLRDLPNDLPPAICYSSPSMKLERGGRHDQ